MQFLNEGEQRLRTIEPTQQVALLLLDINKFADINSTLGHRAGDVVLGQVAERLTALARDDDLVARVGDDEFALFTQVINTSAESTMTLPGEPGSLRQGLRRAREVVDGLAVPFEAAGIRIAVEVSVGLATGSYGRADMAELVRRAAIALKQAKKQHLGVLAYTSDRDVGSTDDLAVLAELGDALRTDDQLELAFQPIVDLETGAPAGVEALIRWRHPRRGTVSPTEFIEIIESSELLAPFTRHVLDLSLSGAANWVTHGIDLPVSVNVSARSLLDPTLPAQIADVLRRHQLPARFLVLEITESVAVSDEDIVYEVLAALREVGVQLAINDFGTGLSLSFITRFAIDELKVDRSFVAEMTESPAAAAVVRGAIELGTRLGARVVAKGVETAEQRAALRALGYTLGQGYQFSRPLPAGKIVNALQVLGDPTHSKVTWLHADEAS